MLLALVGGGFTTLGVLLKIGYDSITAWRVGRREQLARMAPERRAAYERFLTATQQMRRYHTAMNRLIEEQKHGGVEIGADEQAAFPSSSLAELIEAQETLWRLARSYSLITAADAIVQLFIDMTAAERSALECPDQNDEITWFLLQRFLDDRIAEFTYAYRDDLGLGHPKGGPKTFPIVDRERPVSLHESEQILRAHLPRKQVKDAQGNLSPDDDSDLPTETA